MYKEILRYFPKRISEKLEENIRCEGNIEEIRLRNNKPIILKLYNREKIIDLNVNTQDILETLERLCDNSIYSYQSQICEGYITIKGGHRIGITGNAVIDDNKITNINYISGLNFRIARQIIGAGNKALQYVINPKSNTIYNSLIISPPGAGKTTVLRDLVRQISNGIEEQDFKGKNISVVDERGEIAAMYKGTSQNDLGIRTDVIDNCPKHIGMKIMIRSMAPEIIVADEIGKQEDIEAINYAICSGIKGIFTAHGATIQDIKSNPVLKNLIDNNIFERLIFLDTECKGEVNKVYHITK